MATTIIIADDHKVARGGFWVELNRETDYILLGEAKTGEEAITLTLKLLPDVLMLDLWFRDIFGHQVTRILRNNNYQGKILIVSSENSGPQVEQCFLYGADGYHWKGSENSLSQAIETIVSGYRYLDPALRQHLGDLSGLVPFPAIHSFAQVANNSFGITEREWNLLKMMADNNGANAEKLAEKLTLSQNTVYSYSKSIFSKLEVSNRSEAVHKARQRGLL